MTPITIARPTIVRTSPPDADVAWSVALALGWERSSGVLSPSAARAAGASRSRPRTAAPTDLRAGEICITEGSESGSGLDPFIGHVCGVFSGAGAPKVNPGWGGRRRDHPPRGLVAS